MFNNLGDFNSQHLLSFDELSRLKNGGTKIPRKAKRTEIKLDDFTEFPTTYSRGIVTTGELADLVVDKVADGFGLDVKGIAEECMRFQDIEVLCFKLVFCNGKKQANSEKAVEDIKQNDSNDFINSINLLNEAISTGTVHNHSIKLTDTAIDFLLTCLYNDNECFNDTTNKKFLSKYVTYELSVVDGRTPFIAVHGVSLEKACEFVFGPASYSVRVGNGKNENGRILEIERLTHEDTRNAIRKIAGARVDCENLRTPRFNTIK